jgi:hypothetical protein
MGMMNMQIKSEHLLPRNGPSRRAEFYAARLHALRFETFAVRRQMDNPRNACRRELLATRLDATDARAANIYARMQSVTAEAL